MLKKSLIWVLGDGKSINFWHDNWMDDFTLMDKVNPNMSQYIMRNAKVSDVFTSTKQWNVNPLVNIL